MSLVTRTHKRIGEKGSDEGETNEHPSSPTKLVKSPSQTPSRTPSRTPSKKRKARTAGAEPVKKRKQGPTYMPKVVRRMQGERSTIRYNRHGQLIGRNASEMQSYWCGGLLNYFVTYLLMA